MSSATTTNGQPNSRPEPVTSARTARTKATTPKVTCSLGISMDGYVAGHHQGPGSPLGEGGEKVHAWHLDPQNDADVQASAELSAPKGAYIMGRNMFGPGRGAWDEQWTGWWGDDPPYHAPVFVLTHHPRDPVAMAGGTTFHFVADGTASALEQAQDAAEGRGVDIAGGAETARQYLAAGMIDELHLHIAPVLLGGGERLFDGVGDMSFEPIETSSSPSATHVRYRVST